MLRAECFAPFTLHLIIMTDRIQNLDDETAVRILETVARARMRGADVQTDLTPELRQALRDQLPASAGDQSADTGELARQALLLLAEDPETSAAIEHLIENPQPPMRFGLGTTVAIVTAAMIALQTHVRFEKDSSGKWKLLVEKMPTKDGLLKDLVSRILGWKE